MKNLFRLMLIACLVLPFAACKKAEAPKVEKPAVAMPTDPANKQGWMEYMGDIVTRNMDGVSNPNPYAYLLPAESARISRTSTTACSTRPERRRPRHHRRQHAGLRRPVLGQDRRPGHRRVQGVQPGTMKGVKVLFIGTPADGERVKAAVEPSGVTYVFVEAK